MKTQRNKGEALTAEMLQSAVTACDLCIKVSDAREHFGGCIPGWQAFAQRFGFDWKETLRHGIPASRLLQTQDVMAFNLVTFVYRREGLL